MTDQPSEHRIIYWADLIRVVAIYLVVVIHVSGQLTNVWGQIPDGQWISADVYGGVARVSVPLFFMISGYLLLPRAESLRDFYTKRMAKILIPFVVWSLIYLAWFCGGHPNTCTPSLVQNLLLVQGTYYHLWFLYSLISIYLILPVLRLMIRPDTDKKVLWYLIGLWIVFQPILATANQFWNFRVNISAPLATGFLCYFVLGYLLGEIELSRSLVIWSAALWLMGALVTILGTYLFTRNSGQYDGFFYDFVSLNVILASGAAFVLLRWVSDAKVFDSPQIHSITRSLSTAAFGIYLIHIIVIEVLRYGIPFLHIDAFMGNAIWSIPLVATTTFIPSCFIVRLLQKIPVIKQIVP
ncbi:MAG TPA: acyltransferase family protein [Anaerolineales bacterium]|jgi:surface polysaccharide O-acyltransferase-like enzyme|nr:acyltransferase family protein [Anaerolineales bacterium]